MVGNHWKLILTFLIVLNNVYWTQAQDVIKKPPPARDGVKLTVGQREYFVVRRIRMNWYNAYGYCRSHNMVLGTPYTKELNEELLKALNDNKLLNDKHGSSYWLSANDLWEEDKYVWMTNGKPMSYFNWFEGQRTHEPHNKEIEHCVKVYGYQGKSGWKEKKCSCKLNFICEHVSA